MKAVILAAGESSRFKPLSDNRHKSLFEVGGKPLISHTIEGLRNSEIDDVIVVQGPEREIESQIGNEADRYVVQESPKGMGNALEQARHLLDERFLVLTPYRQNSHTLVRKIISEQETSGSDAVLVAAETDTPEKYGVLDFDKDGKVSRIVEKPDPGEAPSSQRVVGMYLLKPSFFQSLDETPVKEYQFEEALNSYIRDRKVSAVKLDEEPGSIKYPWDVFTVTQEIMSKMERKISEKAQIADSAEIKGDVVIENSAKVHENAVIKGPAYIGKNTTVGNNALVRDHTALEENVTIGASAEIKNSVFQSGSSIHSGFVGDSVIGRNTKIGAGTVVANKEFRGESGRETVISELINKDYGKDTGRKACGAFIGDNVDIGVNASIMPGIQIKSNSKVYPGSVVKQNKRE